MFEEKNIKFDKIVFLGCVILFSGVLSITFRTR